MSRAASKIVKLCKYWACVLVPWVAPCKVIGNPGNFFLVESGISKKLCLWNPECWALESVFQLLGSGIPLTIGIRDPCSGQGIQKESGFHNVDSRIQDCLGATRAAPAVFLHARAPDLLSQMLKQRDCSWTNKDLKRAIWFGFTRIKLLLSLNPLT